MWTMGTLIWIPIFTLLMLIGVALLVVTHFVQTDDRTSTEYRYTKYDPEPYWAFRAGVVFVMLLVIGFTAWGMYPYKTDYHKWNVKDGTISEISKRLVGDGDGMQEKFVVVFEGSGQQYGCLDTRCALLEPGDYLKLACKKEWEYGATDGWDCKFRESREKGDA